MVVLSLKLASMTIVEGDYYRDIADNKRLKEVYTTAPRGEIRDRYGRLLAGNKPSFTVQILKDELNIRDIVKKNNALLSLTRLLEEDGVSYVDDYPINLNIFKYINEEDYINEDLNPNDKVVDIIINNNILSDLLKANYIHLNYKEHYKFATVNRAINALNSKDIYVPIEVNTTGKIIEITYKDDEELERWKIKNNIPEDFLPIDTLVKLIDDDKIIIRKILDHPISRKLAYSIMKTKGLTENIIIEEFSLSYDEDYKNQKLLLMSSYPLVTNTSTAKDDFVNVVIGSSINNLLERVIINENDKGKEEILIPGRILLDMVKEIEPDIPITIDLNEDRTSVIYKYTGDIIGNDQNPIDILVEAAKKAKVLKEFIIRKEIRSLAQEQLLNDGINTRISIAKDFEYVFINNKNNWYFDNGIKENSTLKEAFDQLKENYSLPKELSIYESRSVLLLYDQLTKQGHMAYQPINIAYDIKDYTVAKIEEGLKELPGIQISIEPVRYYPRGKAASHILGYLGKISQSREIEKYVEAKNYSPNDIIGKTGIEESYEDYLRGENGIKKVEVDVIGNTTKILSEIKSLPGKNIFLTLDIELQEKVENLLEYTLEKIRVGGTYESPWGDYKFGIDTKKKRPYENATSGATVVIDVKTGQVLAMASFPSYDPNLFATGISKADWLSLFPENEKDPLAPRPLYNIATQTSVQPGSVFKMVTALAALDKGLSPNKKIRDMGYVEFGRDRFPCWLWNQSKSTHGYENMYEALRDSCNYYFYTLALGKNQKTGENLGVKVEIEDIVNLSKQLGLNDKTGIEINIPTEVSGGVPNPQRKIINTKRTLKNYLRNNIHNHIKEGIELDEFEIEERIEEIVSWTELEDTLTRAEVVRRLVSLDLQPEKRILNEIGELEVGLADRIKYTYLNQAGWNISDTLYVTIGQGQGSYTPIQMANYIATISNGGYRHKVSLVDNIKNYNNSKVIFETENQPERIVLNDYNSLEDIKKGMLMSSNDGASRRIFGNFPIEIASKTGTAERDGINPATGETYDNFTWFVGFAPYDDPEIAVATVIFQGGSGGYAGPLTRDIIAEYLGLNAIESKELLPFKNSLVK